MAFRVVSNTFSGGWNKLVQSWVELNDRYFEANHDLPAWYVETSNTAMLAAAAWQIGFMAICEPDLEKSFFSGTRGRPSRYPGRLDMELSMQGKTHWIEAKRCCFELSHSSLYSLRHGHLLASLNEAAANVRQCLKSDEWNARFWAVVFFAGYISDESPERAGRGRDAKCKKLVEHELATFHKNMAVAKLPPRSKKISYVVAENACLDVGPDWDDYVVPALFGMCAAQMIPDGEVS